MTGKKLLSFCIYEICCLNVISKLTKYSFLFFNFFISVVVKLANILLKFGKKCCMYDGEEFL